MREKTSLVLRAYFNGAESSYQESQKKATAAKLKKSDIKTNALLIINQYPSSQTLKLDVALNCLPALS